MSANIWGRGTGWAEGPGGKGAGRHQGGRPVRWDSQKSSTSIQMGVLVWIVLKDHLGSGTLSATVCWLEGGIGTRAGRSTGGREGGMGGMGRPAWLSSFMLRSMRRMSRWFSWICSNASLHWREGGGRGGEGHGGGVGAGDGTKTLWGARECIRALYFGHQAWRGGFCGRNIHTPGHPGSRWPTIRSTRPVGGCDGEGGDLLEDGVLLPLVEELGGQLVHLPLRQRLPVG